VGDRRAGVKRAAGIDESTGKRASAASIGDRRPFSRFGRFFRRTIVRRTDQTPTATGVGGFWMSTGLPVFLLRDRK